MKKIILSIFLIISSFGFSQNDSFEQIAFEFYQDSLLVNENIEGKIFISKYFTDLDFDESYVGLSHVPYDCEKIKKINNQKEIDWVFPDNYELDINRIDQSKFKIKKRKTRKYPMLKIYTPFYFLEDKETIYVKVFLKISRFEESNYTIAFDSNKNIKFWCQTNIIRVINH